MDVACVPLRYSTVTIHLPTGAFIQHLVAISVLARTLEGVGLALGEVAEIKVTGISGSAELSDVMDWVDLNLKDHRPDREARTLEDDVQAAA